MSIDPFPPGSPLNALTPAQIDYLNTLTPLNAMLYQQAYLVARVEPGDRELLQLNNKIHEYKTAIKGLVIMEGRR